MEDWIPSQNEDTGPPTQRELDFMAAFEFAEVVENDVNEAELRAMIPEPEDDLDNPVVVVSGRDNDQDAEEGIKMVGEVADTVVASPLEELCATIGLIDVTRKYRTHKYPVKPHDFRWKSHAADLTFRGQPVLQLVFPPAKLDIMPRSISESLARRMVRYETITGKGEHLFMGALPVNERIRATMMIVTPTDTRFFTMTRTTITESLGPVAAWSDGCPHYFDSDGVVWNQFLVRGDNVVMIDGDMWYYPENLTPTVTVRAGKVVDRQGHELVKDRVTVQDGDYTYNLRSRGLVPRPERPPVSKEVFTSWQRFQAFPMVMYEGIEKSSEFELLLDSRDPRVGDRKIHSLSPAMQKKKNKFREACRREYLSKSRDAYLFSEWECQAIGRNWSMFECVQGLMDPLPSYWKICGKVGKEKREYWLPVTREQQFFSHFARLAKIEIVEVSLVGILPGNWTTVVTWRDPVAIAKSRQRDWEKRARGVRVPTTVFLDQVWPV